MTIVKVQLPLLTPTDEAQLGMALVYAEGPKRMMQQWLDPATRVAMGKDVKAFFEAHFSEGRWTIGRRVRDMSW